MATGSKRGGSRATSSRKKTKKKNQNPGIMEEVMLFVVLGVAILLFLGTCGLLGSFGHIVRGLIIGLFGMPGYLFPFAFFFAGAFWISNKWERVTRVKVTASFILIWVLSCASQLIFAKDTPINKLTDYYTKEVKNGGFLGGVATHFFCKFLGMAGTVVILIVLAIICIVLLSDRSLFTSVKEGTKLLSNDYKRNAEYRREMSEIRSIEREERDMQRWQRRNERHEEYVRKQEEKRAAQLEERRRKAEQKHAETSERIRFEALNLKQQEELRQQQIEEQKRQEEYRQILAATEVKDEVSDNQRIDEPESLFYGNASSYTDKIIAVTHDELIAEAVSNVTNGLLSATKIDEVKVSGDITEITGNHNADKDFVDYVNNNLKSSHSISVDPQEVLKQDAYERDIYVDDSEVFNEDYSDISRLFAGKNRTSSNHRINIDVNVNNQNPSPKYDETLAYEEASDYEEVDYTADSYEEEPEYSRVEESYEYEAPRPKATSVAPVNQPSTSSSLNLSEENEKPHPVAKSVTEGKAVKVKKTGRYKMPPVTLLNEVKNDNSAKNAADELNETAIELKETLHTFGLDVTIIGSSRGPAVTRYEIQMPAGVSVKKITNLTDDIMMSLGAKDIRIEAPIPGKKAVGIELPNKVSSMVHFRELIDSKSFKNFDSKVAFGVGKDLSGDIVVTDIAKMPHLLIAGATGSGKSVCINTLIMSILFKAHPDEVKLIMIDPKMVELSIYNDIPHLLIPVVTDPKKASMALNWAVNEMTLRYQKFASVGVRDMKGYNNKILSSPEYASSDEHKFMPQIVIVVDELADLMMVAAKEVEEAICRLAQLARAAGIYLILATQRPSVDVITGLIKANMPSRIAFSVSSGVDSRTILDSMGAEKLLGNGDMLFFPRGYNKPSRVQGAFVSDDEVQRVVDYIKAQTDGNVYDEEAINAVNAGGSSSAGGSGGLVDPNDAYDDLFVVAGHAVIEADKASIGMLQRKFKVGFNRAARIMDQLADEGVVGPEEGTKPRRILMSMEQFNQMLEEKNHS